MDDAINSLKEALQFSPDNIPLRLHLAETLVSNHRLDEAEEEFQKILQLDNQHQKAKIGLAHIFHQKGEYSKCLVILEAFINAPSATDTELLVLYAKTLLKEGSTQQAIEIYKQVLDRDPSFSDEELDSQLKVAPTIEETIEALEDEFANADFVQKPTIDLS